ncbi:PQQ-dependent sugar dehydrogenase [Benzoatithermus flavus]|uniref:PQQ-dependent sugar dehydrogenase n=1 Tax=Benzoatithermus flavus TaxID=3108223 RepID=A0ABU8XR87_9PROT
MRTIALAVAMLSAAGCAHAAAPQGPVRTEKATFRVVEVVGGLENPWGMAFLPDGGMLVTERPGRLRLVENGKLRAEPVKGGPEVYARGQGGLLDVALDPAFAQNRRIYLSYAHAEGGKTTTRVMRARYAPEGLSEQKVIFSAEPMIQSSAHFGSRLAFGTDGTLFVTVGERFVARQDAQNLATDLGKVLRITTDGTAPPDNPFVGREGARPEIYTFGHRNPQGLVVDPRNGRVWEQEHGAMGGDEINLLKPGANYGWPEVAYGKNYDGTTIGTGRSIAPGVEAPVFYWDPSIAPSGMTLYLGDRFPGWNGDLLVGALKYQLVSRLDLDEEGRVVKEERFLEGALGRIRDVRTGPDGLVYLLTDEDPGGLYRLEPVTEAG